METSIFAFATDLADEGLETVLDNVQHRAGLEGITIAAVYHEARDSSRTTRYASSVSSRAALPTSGPTPLATAGSQSSRGSPGSHRSGTSSASSPMGRAARPFRPRLDRVLHADWQVGGGEEHAERTAFGDPCLTELCPANPDVRAYARALAGDIARRGVKTIVAESLHYRPLEHGYHHERSFIQLVAGALPVRPLLLPALSRCRLGGRGGHEGVQLFGPAGDQRSSPAGPTTAGAPTSTNEHPRRGRARPLPRGTRAHRLTLAGETAEAAAAEARA